MAAASVWDRVARDELRLGRWRVAAWDACGRIGALVGATVFALRAPAPRTTIALAIAASLATFIAWRAVSKRWRGGRYVLLEHAVLAVSAIALVGGAALVAAAVPALALCLAIGRIGCLLHGCCHGQPCRRGLRYPHLAPWFAGSPWMRMRVFPLPLVEALALLALAGIGLVADPAFVPAGYAVVRFELERWRGDRRRYIGPLSHNQWWCIAIAVLVTVIGPWWLGAASLSLIAALFALRIRRLSPALPVSSREVLATLDYSVMRAWQGVPSRVHGLDIAPTPDGPRLRNAGSTMSRNAIRAMQRVVRDAGPPAAKRATA